MKITDVINAISKTLYTSLNIAVNVEDIDNIKRPALVLKPISVDKTLMGQNRQRLTIGWDLIYLPSKQKGCNMEIYDMLDNIDLAFDKKGYKWVKIQDRGVQIENVEHNIFDNVGHYMFKTDFYSYYGTSYKYELMEELELHFNEN